RVTIPEKIQLDTEQAQNVRRGEHLPESEAVAPQEESWATEVIPPANIQMFWQDKWQPIKAGAWDEMTVAMNDEEGYYEDWEGGPIGDSIAEVLSDIEETTMPKTAAGKKNGRNPLLTK